ncbi:Rcs stress response system protein RcsF [Psychromonas sp. MME2]|uniref:Rcs stress response system protein RcsF n=1 Tax=unclassified Psychromonas TaxID=2614957 RepID=UPI00339C54AB
MLRSTLCICALIFTTACSNYDFTSNLDKENFTDYFKPSEVTIYSKEQLPKLDYTFIATVEGSSCQEEANDRPADIKEARTKARIQAADLNANGIVIQSCLSFEADETCLSNIICYAQAIHVNLPEETK